METKDIKGFVINNGLGNVIFSKGLLKTIINKVLVVYPNLVYQDHKIENLTDDYLEVSLYLNSTTKYEAKTLDILQKELLLVIKKSLSINCILAINITYGK